MRLNSLYNANNHFFSKSKAYRVFWLICSSPIFALPSRYFSFPRILLCRLFGAKIEENVLLSSGVSITCPWNLYIGRDTAIGPRVRIINHSRVYLGRQVTISQDTVLNTGSHKYNCGMQFVSKRIIIRSHSWIAAECFVHGGTLVGEGTVIGCCSNIRGHFLSWSVYETPSPMLIKQRTSY